MESLDLVVIGAGWSGLAALKTYRQVNPSAQVCLLDGASSVGGVWAKHRLWDGLKSNNMRGTYEYSDFPMDDSFGVKHGEHVPGHAVQRYLEAYSEHFNLTPHIRLNSQVSVVEHNADASWSITYITNAAAAAAGGADESTSSTVQINARKLIIATGITSQPYLPHIPGDESFGRPLLHSSEMPKYHESVIRQSNNRIAVFGATKSAWDAVYTAATAGAAVDWIIRDNGHGPCWMAPPYVTPMHKWLEKLVTTRLLTWFSPCIWSDNNPDADGGSCIRSFLHGSKIGRKITDTFWSILANDVVSANKYNAHPETKKLQPWISPFWVASGLSILNYPTNFFDLVTSGKVKIHVDHITSLSEGTIHLAKDGALSDIDALVVASGWKPTPNIDFRPASLLSELGFPTAEDPFPSSLVSAADEEILRRFPRLVDQPAHNSPEPYTPLAKDAQAESQALHPFRLTRFLVPATKRLARERSVAFMGIAMTINTPLLAQTQALWITAFFSNRLSLSSIAKETCPDTLRNVLSKETAADSASASAAADQPVNGDDDANILWETALHTQFGIHRYPGGLGKRNPDFVFDAVPYVDVLLKDLGVRGDRKREKGWRQWLEPHGMEDYRGVVEEWMGSQGLGQAGTQEG